MISFVNLTNPTQIYGVCVRADNSEIDSKIAPLWAKFMDEIYDGNSKIYALYKDYESDFRGKYTLHIGTKKASENLIKASIDSGIYAVFSRNLDAEISEVLRELWAEIWDYFSKNRELKRSYICDFEIYEEGRVKIYIGLEKSRMLANLEKINQI